MNEDLIKKLPSDVRKEFMKYALKLSEKKIQSKVENDFPFFCQTRLA
jgi:hypothetical protein